MSEPKITLNVVTDPSEIPFDPGKEMPRSTTFRSLEEKGVLGIERFLTSPLTGIMEQTLERLENNGGRLYRSHVWPYNHRGSFVKLNDVHNTRTSFVSTEQTTIKALIRRDMAKAYNVDGGPALSGDKPEYIQITQIGKDYAATLKEVRKSRREEAKKEREARKAIKAKTEAIPIKSIVISAFRLAKHSGYEITITYENGQKSHPIYFDKSLTEVCAIADRRAKIAGFKGAISIK